MLIDNAAEIALIGSMLIDEKCRAVMLAKMRQADFGAAGCREAFGVIAAMEEEGAEIDFITVGARCGDPEYMTGYLRQCCETVVTTANADEYAAIVKKQAAARRVAAIGDTLVLSQDYRSDAIQGIADLQGVLDETTSAEVVSADAWADAFITEELEIIKDPSSAYCPTGWRDFDNMLGGGLFNAGLYILGARPGMGKTTVALNIAEQVAAKGMPVLFISLEMTKRQVMCKRLAAFSSLPYAKLISGCLTWDEQIDMEEALAVLKTRPVFINNRFGLTVSDVSAMIRQVRGCRLVVVDYFGLISVEGEAKGRYEDYTQISGRLKQLACSLNIPILCLAQLNRETEKRTKKRPGLSDLRDTGAIEQDADGVIFLHREGYYSEDAPPEIELILAKNRHGSTGSVTMYWEGAESRVSMMSTREG